MRFGRHYISDFKILKWGLLIILFGFCVFVGMVLAIVSVIT